MRISLLYLFLIPVSLAVWAEPQNSEVPSYHTFAFGQLETDLSFIHDSSSFRRQLFDVLGSPDDVLIERAHIDNDPTYKPLIDTWIYNDQLKIRFVSDQSNYWLSTEIMGPGPHEAALGIRVGMGREEVLSRLGKTPFGHSYETKIEGYSTEIINHAKVRIGYFIYLDQLGKVSRISWDVGRH